MITVVVYINNQPIILKTARNMGKTDSEGYTEYRDEAGTLILHKGKRGATYLAKLMLDEWKPPKHG